VADAQIEHVSEAVVSETVVSEDYVRVVRPRTAAALKRLGGLIAGADAFAVVLSAGMMDVLRPRPARLSTGLFLALIAVAAVILASFGVYAIARRAPADEARRIANAAMVTLGVWLLLFVAVSRGPVRIDWLAGWWTLAFLLILSTRYGWHKYLGRQRARGRLRFRTLVVGTNGEAANLVEVLKRPRSGFDPMGVATATPLVGDLPFDLPVLGDVDSLSKIVDDAGVECVFIASTAVRGAQLKTISKVLRGHDVEVRMSANMTDILASRLHLQQIENTLALSLQPVRLTGPQALAKRVFDIGVASGTLLVLSPVLLAVAAAIRLGSGPVFFRQTRIGMKGRPFQMYKFRTMIPDADQWLAMLADRNEADGPLFKMRDDPRVTRVGRLLRRWSIDELPQLINVIRGDMSLVGPRPALPSEVMAYEDWHRDRLEVRPGMSGLWQVKGRSELAFDEAVRMDLFYIENWSVVYDLYILFKTPHAVVSRRGAY
jgi:exopolysaccharide biosynthesis polyprenyl glycosylphosphotransferase